MILVLIIVVIIIVNAINTFANSSLKNHSSANVQELETLKEKILSKI